jgi:hypothetical protein
MSELYMWQAFDKDNLKKDEVLRDRGKIYIGTDRDKAYLYATHEPTHVIPYYSWTGYKEEGNVFRDIYELRGKQCLKGPDGYEQFCTLTGRDHSVSLEDWFRVSTNCAIIWDAILVTNVEIPRTSVCGLSYRSRFSRILNTPNTLSATLYDLL